MWDRTLPTQLQCMLLRLRTFNLKLASHVSHWQGRDGCAACSWCGMAETETHLLHECPAYDALRTRYGIPTICTPSMFQLPQVVGVARYVRAVLKCRAREGPRPPVSHPWVQARWCCTGWSLIREPAGPGVLQLLLVGLLAVLFFFVATHYGPWMPTGSNVNK